MSGQNEKLTAKQFAVQAASMAKPPYYSEPFEPHTWVLCAMDNYAAQQVEHATAELREQLEKIKRYLAHKDKAIFLQKQKRKNEAKQIRQLEKSLKNVKSQKEIKLSTQKHEWVGDSPYCANCGLYLLSCNEFDVCMGKINLNQIPK